MITVAIACWKGGVGKTTAAVTLGAMLAQQGRRVLICDVDTQSHVADFLGVKKSPGLYRLLIDGAGRDAITPARERLDIIAGDRTTSQAKIVLAGQPFREQVLGQALSRLGDDYDVCLIDTAPSVDLLQISALLAGDLLLVPTSLDFLAGVGVNDVLTSLATVQAFSDRAARFAGVIPQFWERRTRESHVQLKALAEQFGAAVWPPIPLDTRAREAPAFGRTLLEHCPKSRAMMGADTDDGQQVGGYWQVFARLEEWL